MIIETFDIKLIVYNLQPTILFTLTFQDSLELLLDISNKYLYLLDISNKYEIQYTNKHCTLLN